MRRFWEVIQAEAYAGPITDRLWVIGGWIVRTRISTGVHQIFVSDSDHEWKLDKEDRDA
jgi:hypothetical protein